MSGRKMSRLDEFADTMLLFASLQIVAEGDRGDDDRVGGGIDLAAVAFVVVK